MTCKCSDKSRDPWVFTLDGEGGGGGPLCAFSPANHRTRRSAVRTTARGPGRRGDYHLAPTSGDALILMSATANP